MQLPENHGRGGKTLDKSEFGERVRACQTKLYRVALSVTGNPADAEDAAADAVLKAWEKRDSLKNEEYFETWLTRILINAARDVVRRRRRRSEAALSESLPAAEKTDTGVMEAIDRVEEKYRLPLVMSGALGMTASEIARALGVPEGVVRWRIQKGRKLARAEIRREEGEV